jgi:thiol:disulfide interchange protein DsbC
MTRDTAPAVANCDSSALTRNVEFGRKHKITGTPTLLAQDGKRVPGAIPVAQIEQLIAGKP